MSFVGMTNPKLIALSENPTAGVPYVTVQSCNVYKATDTCTADSPKSPAAAAGLQDNDKILAVNGVAVANYGELVNTIRSQPYTGSPTTTVTLTWQHGND